jgi:nicotinamide riboside transporter PnuC
MGCWFNIQKSVAGWIIWSFANVGWILSFMAKGMMAESTLFTVYLALSIYGTIKWSSAAGQEQELDPARPVDLGAEE